MRDYRNLRVWHLAQALAIEVIQALPSRKCQRVPGLRAQTVRAATSIANNIAEGCAKDSPAEFLRFLEMALGSLLELETELDLARKTRLLIPNDSRQLGRHTTTLRRMLITFMERVWDDVPRPRGPKRRPFSSPERSPQ